MMEYTDDVYRALLRMLSRRATLYTEMVPSSALIRHDGPDLERWLDFEGRGPEGPVVLQLGGADAETLAHAVTKAAPWEYDAINLNCGCPSPKVVGKGCFGAALMRDAALVAQVCAAMREAAGEIPITVKCRIGVAETVADLQEGAEDDEATFEELCNFVRTVSEQGGVQRFIVHARKAVLSGLCPRANRRVPPLRHDLVVRLAREFPGLSVVLNGGVSQVGEVVDLLREHEGVLDGVMCGRAIEARPWDFAVVDSEVFRDPRGDPAASRRRVLEEYVAFAEEVERRTKGQVEGQDETLAKNRRRALRFRLLKAIKSLFAGEPFGRQFGKSIAQAEQAAAAQPDAIAIADVIGSAMATQAQEVLDAPPGQGGHGLAMPLPRSSSSSSASVGALAQQPEAR